jgi:hypothetical protein
MADIRRTVAPNLRLWMEFIITVGVLAGNFVVLITPTPEIVNQGAYQLSTLVLGYWFGRGSVMIEQRRNMKGE